MRIPLSRCETMVLDPRTLQLILGDHVSEKWFLGTADRGHGHSSHAVITEDGQVVVGPCPPNIAMHIVMLHNATLEQGRTDIPDYHRELLDPHEILERQVAWHKKYVFDEATPEEFAQWETAFRERFAEENGL